MRAYYAFISTLCQMHTSALLELDTPVFVQILSSLKEGLSSLTTITSVSSQSCDALGTLCARSMGQYANAQITNER